MKLDGKAGNGNKPCSIRAKFTRGEELKYISHLDTMRTFQRALRRSGIPISYSEGFNPQPHIVFGLPLAVGVTSEAEYADLRLDEYMEPDLFVQHLNYELPPGLKVCEAEIKINKENIMAAISLASYKVLVCASLNMGIDEVWQKLCEFSKLKTITVKKTGKHNKENKKPVKNADIRPMIHKLDIDNAGDIDIASDAAGRFIISALVSAGSKGNLKPVTLVSALNAHMGTAFKIIHIHRTGLFIKDGGSIIEPLDPRALGY